MEIKTHSGRIEIKAVDDGEMTFTGLAAHYNNVDGYRDIVLPGAFAATMAQHDAAATKPAMLWNHDAKALPIGVWIDWEDSQEGLKMTGRFLDTQAGRDAYQAVKSGAVNGLSIGYTTVDFEIVRDDGLTIRHLKAVDLWEVSVVTFPANPLTRISEVKENILPENDDDIGAAFDALMKQVETLKLRLVPPASPDAEAKIEDAEEDIDEPSDETEKEAKYLAAIEAVKTLRLKLQQENHG